MIGKWFYHILGPAHQIFIWLCSGFYSLSHVGWSEAFHNFIYTYYIAVVHFLWFILPQFFKSQIICKGIFIIVKATWFIYLCCLYDLTFCKIPILTYDISFHKMISHQTWVPRKTRFSFGWNHEVKSSSTENNYLMMCLVASQIVPQSSSLDGSAWNLSRTFPH